MTVPPPPGPPAALPVTYATGSLVAFVLDDLALLLDLSPDSRLLEQCWSVAAAGQGLDAVLAVITAPGPQAVTNFAAVARTADGTRVVVAGSGRAEINGSPLTADGGATRDERLAGRPPVRLAASADAGADQAVLPLVSGIASASAVGVGVAANSIAAQPAQPAQAAAAPPEAPRPVDPVPVPRVSTDTMPPASVFDSGIIESLPWRGTGEEPAAGADPAPPPPPPPPPPAAPSWNDPFAAGPGGGVAEASQHNLWGAPAQPAWPEPEPRPDQSSPPTSPEPVPGTPPGGGWGAPGAPAAGASPWAPPGATAAEELNPTAVAPTDESTGPVVHAFTCPRGHLNPPYAGTCRICDEPIAAQEGFAVPRPSLGVLKLSTGDTVPLDRDVVLGRAPFHADENAASRPHLVQLSSPGNDISRSHVRVNLENWFVQVTDLGSTNGTVVTLPDQAPVRLRPHDPFTILPGTTVNIADEVTLRYEVS